jgi:hypothetical protein
VQKVVLPDSLPGPGDTWRDAEATNGSPVLTLLVVVCTILGAVTLAILVLATRETLRIGRTDHEARSRPRLPYRKLPRLPR